VAAVALAVVGLVGWLLTDSGSPKRPLPVVAALGTTIPQPAFSPLPAVTEAPTTVPETVPPPAVRVPDPGGSRLRLGVAHPVGSPALIADAVGPTLGLYSEPGQPEPDDVAKNPTREGLPVVGLVMQRQGDWVELQISRRPNEATAWVRAAEVDIHSTPYRLRVDSSSHRLAAYQGDAVVMDVPVAVGTGGTPTPTGTFFIDGAVRLSDPTGPYGAYQLSVAAFSNVLSSFGGGNGQIALHGTNSPDLIGGSVSHGCVRMQNDDITRLAGMVPVGTPVEIF
jgi:lipoprotein-anchoring transpeptidase ErfK/SrfK